MYAYELPVIEKFEIASNTSVIRFGLEGKEFNFLPGQYIQIEVNLSNCPEFNLQPGKNPIQKRSYSISSSPEEKSYLEITVKETRQGFVSTFLDEFLKIGEKIKVLGPLGKFVFDEKTAKKNILLIGAGSGIGPLLSILRYIAGKKLPNQATLLYSNKTEDDIIWRGELQALAQHPNVKCILTLTQQQWSGRTGRIDKDLLNTSISEKNQTDCFICGPVPFADEMEKQLLDLGISQESIKREAF